MSQKLSAVKQIISSRQKLTFEPKSILKKKSCFQMSWKWAENDKREIQKLVGMIWKRYSKQNWWDMLYLRVIPRKSRFYIKSQFWKSFHWGHFLSKDQLVPVAKWDEIFSEKGPFSTFRCFNKIFIRICKDGLISESFSFRRKSPKKRCQITLLSTIYLKRRCSGEWFDNFFLRSKPNWKTFWDKATFSMLYNCVKYM